MTQSNSAARAVEDFQDAKTPVQRKRIVKSSTAFRTIGEAAEELGLKTHVLRFWETKFAELTPMKRKDGRRFYRPEDMTVLRVLQVLLHEQGMTIKGAQRMLKSRKPDDILNEVIAMTTLTEQPTSAGQSVRDLQEAVENAVTSGAFRGTDAETVLNDRSRDKLNQLLGDLEDLKGRLDEVRKTA